MLVCPQCRNENLEDADFCRVCGRSLEPAGAYMRRLDRREDTEPELDLPPPRAGRPWLAVTVLVVVALGVAIWSLFATTAPDPCQGKYSSAQFPYCAEIPQGWTAGAELESAESLDRFVFGTGEPEAVADVRVEELVDPTVQTEQYVQQFRTSQEARGLDPTSVGSVDVGGESALTWDYLPPPPEGEPQAVVREVILVRAEGAWRITLIANEEAYEDALVALQRIFSSWEWKS